MPGSQLDSEVEALKKRISQALTHQQRAEARVAMAAAQATLASEALRTEFGITPEEGPALLEKLRADLAAEAERVRAALERAEASE